MAEKQPPRTRIFAGERMTWISPVTLKDLVEAKAKYPQAPVIMGNTSTGMQSPRPRGLLTGKPRKIVSGEAAGLSHCSQVSQLPDTSDSYCPCWEPCTELHQVVGGQGRKGCFLGKKEQQFQGLPSCPCSLWRPIWACL